MNRKKTIQRPFNLLIHSPVINMTNDIDDMTI